jgi:uncharacterized cupin superfamily protein
MSRSTHHVEGGKIPSGEWPQWPNPSMKFEDSRTPVPTGTIESQTGDKRVSSGMWSVEPSAFEVTFPWDEFIHILEGEAVVEDLETGRSIDLKPGHIAHFELGSRTRWTVTKTLRKYYVIRTPEPLVR